VPIPFNDVDEAGDGLGRAAFLTVRASPDLGGWLGGLLVINARGEPLEFAYNRVRVPQPFLWRESDLNRYIQRRLAASLLSVCAQQPRLLLCLKDEIGDRLFGQDLQLEIPVVRVGPTAPPTRRVDPVTGEVLEEDSPPPAHAAWQPALPEDGSIEQRLFEHLRVHGLLLEPFERSAAGLREVYARLRVPSPGD